MQKVPFKKHNTSKTKTVSVTRGRHSNLHQANQTVHTPPRPPSPSSNLESKTSTSTSLTSVAEAVLPRHQAARRQSFRTPPSGYLHSLTKPRLRARCGVPRHQQVFRPQVSMDAPSRVTMRVAQGFKHSNRNLTRVVLRVGRQPRDGVQHFTAVQKLSFRTDQRKGVKRVGVS